MFVFHFGVSSRTFGVGAVAGLRNVKDAARVAHAVMKYTEHTMLVGSLGRSVYFCLLLDEDGNCRRICVRRMGGNAFWAS